MANIYGALLTEVVHPFARAGAANTTGAIYSATVSTSSPSTPYVFTNIETVTVPLPKNSMITELEFGLTAGYSVTTTTAGFELRYAIRDNGNTTSVDYLVTSTASSAGITGTTLTDVTYMGRVSPSSGTYFTGKGSFDLLADVASDSATSGKAQGATKQSSYVQYSYYLVG